MEYFLSDVEMLESNRTLKNKNDSDKIIITSVPQLEQEGLGNIVSIKPRLNKTRRMRNEATQTDYLVSKLQFSKRNVNERKNSENLKQQAEYLIQSVDSLIGGTGDTDMKGNMMISQAMFTNEKYIEKVKRLGRHMNSTSAINKRKRESSEKKDKEKSYNLDKKRVPRNSQS